MSDVLDILLSADRPALPEKEYKLKRLSKELGADVIFKLRALSFSRVAELRELHDGADMPVWIALEGITSPDLRNRELMSKYGAETPIDLLKNMLLPGEIEDLQLRVERLSGYKMSTLEELKKK